MNLPQIKNKRVLLLVGGGALLLIIILLLPPGGGREVELPPGFERAVAPERELPVKPAPVAPVAVVAIERVEAPLPEVIEEARKRHTLGWGRDPFLIGEVVEMQLRLTAILMPKRIAIINGVKVRIGDKTGEYEVVDIAEGVVTLKKEGIIHRLLF